jgi:hypothetical protein
MKTRLLLALGLLALPGPRQSRAEDEVVAPVARVHSHFARFPSFAAAAEDLKLFRFAPPAGTSPRLNAAMNRSRTAFNAQKAKVKELRTRLDEQAKGMLAAALNVLRTHGGWWSEHFGSRMIAEQEYLAHKIAWLMSMAQLHFARAELRRIATEYYTTSFATIFPAYPRAQRQEVLNWFEQRCRKLRTERMRAFCEIEDQRRKAFRDIYTKIRNALEGKVEDLPTRAKALLDEARLQWQYAWLGPESAVHVTTYGRLLERHALALDSQELQPKLVEAVKKLERFSPRDTLPEAGMEIREQILRTRARRARLVLLRREMQIEAAHRTRVSLALGVMASVKDAGSKLWQVAAEGSIARMDRKAYEVYATPAAVVAISYKLLGDLWGSLVSTPLKDTAINLMEQAFPKNWGVSIDDSVDEAWKDYLKQREEIDRQIKYLGRIAESFGASEARKYIEYFRKDRAGKGLNAGSLPPGVPFTFRSLLHDSRFTAATKGGLAGLFTVFCLDPKDEVVVHLRVSQYEQAANLRAAASRLAAARGRKIDPHDLASTQKAIDAALGPKDKVTGRRNPYHEPDDFLHYVPVISGLKALWNLNRITSMLSEELKGNLRSEDAYLESLGGLQKTLRDLVHQLELFDFDLARLRAKMPSAYDGHVRLLGQSGEYVNAITRLKVAESERVKLYRVARYATADGGLTSRGKRLLAVDHALQQLDVATLQARAAWLRLVYLGLTRDYAAAAEQVKQLPVLEERRQKAQGKKEIKKLDLSWAEKAFRREALAQELIAIYGELYHSALREVVVSVADSVFKNLLFKSDLPLGQAVAADLAMTSEQFGEKLIGAFNPWAGKFSGSGIADTVWGAFKDAGASAAGQKLHEFTGVGQKGDWESAVGLALDLTESARGELASRLRDTAVRWVYPDSEEQARRLQVQEAAKDLGDYEERTIVPLRKELEELGDSEPDRRRRTELVEQIAGFEESPDAVGLRARLAAAVADADGSAQRRREAEEDLSEVSGLLAVGLAEARAVDRTARVDPKDKDKIRGIATELAAHDYMRRIIRGLGTEEDLRRLVDPKDGLRLRERALKPGLSLPILKRALNLVVARDPSAAARLKEVARELDRIRHRQLRQLMQEFVRESTLGSRIEYIAHDGPSVDDPDFGGLRTDLSLRVKVKEGVDQAEVDRALREFLAKRRHPIDGPGALVGGIDVQAPRAREREGPPEAKVWDRDKELPEQPPSSGTKELNDRVVERIEKDQGFRADHAREMYRCAQRLSCFLIIRNGNPISVPHFERGDCVPKDMTCKAKTMRVGEHAGLVVDPFHRKQAAAYAKAIRDAETAGDTARVAELQRGKARAEAAWTDYGHEMQETHGYRVDPETGVILAPVTPEGGGPTEYRKIHGDYDLHGVFRVADGGCMRVDLGGGSKESNAATAKFRDQLNRNICGEGHKKMIRHGGQDDWIKPHKKPDPPVTVFFPDGRPPMVLKTPEDMRRFYETEMKIAWEYREAPSLVRFRDRVYCSGPAQPYVHNLLAFHKGVLVGKPEAAWREVDGRRAPLLVLDQARQLAFLTDPRFERAEVAALATEPARRKRVGEAFAKADRFLGLVDAYLIGSTYAHERYRQRGARKDKGYFGAMLEDLEELVKTKHVEPLREEDLPQLRQLVALHAGGARPVSEAGLALLDWMRAKSIEIVAHTAPYWKHVRLEGHRGILRQAARIARENASGKSAELVPLLVPPFAGDRTLSIEEYRDALARAMEEVRGERASIARAQTQARRTVVQAHGARALDDAARKGVKAAVRAGLKPGGEAQSWASRMGVGQWELAAESAGS